MYCKCYLFLLCKAEFSASLLQSSDADLLLKKHFFILSMLKTVALLNHFVETNFFPIGFFKEQIVKKNKKQQ